MKKRLLIGILLLLLTNSAAFASENVQIIGEQSPMPYVFKDPQPYFNSNDKLMFPLTHFETLFHGDIHYYIEDDCITIIQNILDIQTNVCINIDDYVMQKDSEKIIVDAAPEKKNEIIYIPLELIGNALGYFVQDDGPSKPVRFYQYTSLYIYVWQERTDTAIDDVRYSYKIGGDAVVNVCDIKERSTSNVEEIFSILSKLPAGVKVLTTELYSVRNNRVPQTIISEITKRVFDSGYQSRFDSFCIDKIPAIIQNLGIDKNAWFSEELFALNEEAIYNSTQEIYRYAIFPAFQASQSVRIEIRENGEADVHYKLGNFNMGSTENDELVTTRKAKLSTSKTQMFLNLLEQSHYWTLPSEAEQYGLDGYDVIVEGIKDGKYHIVNRWIPEEGDPIYAVQEFFQELIRQLFSN